LWFEEEGTIANYSVAQVIEAYSANPEIQVRTELIDLDKKQKTILSREAGSAMLARTDRVVEGANLEENEYGNTIFADAFFFITGFHGFHVVSGIAINIIVFFSFKFIIFVEPGLTTFSYFTITPTPLSTSSKFSISYFRTDAIDYVDIFVNIIGLTSNNIVSIVLNKQTLIKARMKNC